jgi:hypothetical protein
MENYRRIRVTEVTPGGEQATVVGADSGARPRRILTKALHASAVTRSGRRRMSGYALESQPEPPAKPHGTADNSAADHVEER